MTIRGCIPLRWCRHLANGCASAVLVPRHSARGPSRQRCGVTDTTVHSNTATHQLAQPAWASFRETPPSTDQHDPDSERYRWRLARRTAGIAQAHALRQHISSARAIGRQLGVNQGTIRKWPRSRRLIQRSLANWPPRPSWDAARATTATLATGDEVRRVREDLRPTAHSSLHQTDNSPRRAPNARRIVGWALGK